mmetsp:Transcript_27226/g.49248  ORF Transcript_27226/g.49248 Transcript_27226/m.49248 type:complete len:101 (-) Transcript_27226:269-571(-)
MAQTFRPLGMDENTLIMVNCFFAMLFGAAVLSLLSAFQIMPRRCPCGGAPGDYGFCEAWQDFRTILSFSLGALLCHMGSKEKDAPRPACNRSGLDAAMIW